MKVEYINPFINSVNNTIETMLGVKAERSAPFVKDNLLARGDVSGLIGFADKNISGSVALSFPTGTALKIYRMMMGETVFKINSDVQDTVGELTNIVCGGAKQEFAKIGLSFHISIPSIIVGKGHQITHKQHTPVVVIPFSIEQSPFAMEITMKIIPKKL